MNSEEFVKRITQVVYEATIRGTLSLLEKPPGRRPTKALVELSQWFHGLSSHDSERVGAVVRLAVRDAVFQMLTVIDGATSVWESSEEMGDFELRYNTKTESTLLNGPTGEFLHDLFAGEVPLE